MAEAIRSRGGVLTQLPRDRGTLAIVIGGALLIALVWSAALERRSHERGEASERAIDHTANLAIAFEEQTLRTIAGVDHVLRFIASGDFGRSKMISPEVRAGVLKDESLANLSVVDRQGRVIASAEEFVEVEVSDRDYFRFHRDRADGGLFIGRPVQGRVVPRTVIHFARRINDARGGFNGVALASVEAVHLTEFYRRLSLGRLGMVQLVGLDGVALARRLGGQTIFGSDMRDSELLHQAAGRDAGSFISRGRTDGHMRQQSYRVLKDYGLVVSVGIAVDEVFAEVSRRERDLYAVCAVATLGILLFGAVLLVSRARRARDSAAASAAEAARRESERRFYDMLANVRLVSLMLDREARITYCNDYLLRLTGWTREEVLGRDWFELFIPPELTEVRDMFADLIADRPVAWHHENEILMRSGERRLIRWNNTVLKTAAGDVIGTASIGEDVTERKAAERKLHEQLDELRRFQAVTVDRELRMIELQRELEAQRSGIHA